MGRKAVMEIVLFNNINQDFSEISRTLQSTAKPDDGPHGE